MVDRQFYESGALYEASVSGIAESTFAVDSLGRPVEPPFRRSRTVVDREGRVRRTEYLDPLTRRVVQRETFSYDDQGRLVEWTRSRPASEVTVASVTRTEFPGIAPYGMAQTFTYFDDGGLKEWRACTVSVDQRLQDCSEDYLVLDRRGLVIEIGWSGEVIRIDRDSLGTASAIEVVATGTGNVDSRTVSCADHGCIERQGDEVVGRSFYDAAGRIVQYHAFSKDSPEYYTTITWVYDDHGRAQSVAKAFDSYEFGHDADGRIVAVTQTAIPRTVRRKFGTRGQLREQQPPLFFRRLSPTATGTEKYTYNDFGLIAEIVVEGDDGRVTSKTVLDYKLRRGSSRMARK
jgi:hypothetical protein